MVRTVRTPGVAASMFGNDLYGWAWLSVLQEQQRQPEKIKAVPVVTPPPKPVKFNGGKVIS